MSGAPGPLQQTNPKLLPKIVERMQPSLFDDGPYQFGDWIIRAAYPEIPCQVVRCVAYPCHGGFLVEHNGAGIPYLAIDQVMPCPEEKIPISKRKTMALKKPNLKPTEKPIAKPRKKHSLGQGVNMFGILE
jgi:hypothetical protein